MGSCVGKRSKSSTDGTDGSASSKKSKKGPFPFEEQVMQEHIVSSGKFTHAAIVGLSDGKVRAITPSSFKPKDSGIKDILEALKGNTDDLASNGMNLGGGTKVCNPGKIDEGKAIYGTDGETGGCTVFATKQCALIVFYESDTASAIRLASELAEHMSENDH